jgi:hypothetical protein
MGAQLVMDAIVGQLAARAGNIIIEVEAVETSKKGTNHWLTVQ